MTCGEFNDCVQCFLDGELLVPSESFEAHLSRCRECRARFAAAVELSRGIRLTPAVKPPVELAARVAARANADFARARVVRRTWAATALAASIFLAFALISRGPTPSATPDSRLVAAGESPLSVDESLTTAGTALTSFVTTTARETLKQGQGLIPANVQTPPLGGIDALQESLEPSAQSLRQAGQTLTASLEPVTHSARRAFESFVQDLSPMTD